MMRTKTFDQKVAEFEKHPLQADRLQTIQVNIGLRCNQECRHCHVVSSPRRTEAMDWSTMESVLEAARKSGAEWIDITGGAPELHPDFRRFVVHSRQIGCQVMVRTNLTVLLLVEMEEMIDFFVTQKVHLVASLPCYLEENVNRQRGEGVYRASIEALKKLNNAGYGRSGELPISLVYNPLGDHLPPDQLTLEQHYRAQLRERFGIEFTRLICLANMPIGRFAADLRRQGRFGEYLQLLQDSFNPQNLKGLMCRHQISVRWDGTVFDCDFNLAIRLPVNHGAPTHIRDFDPEVFTQRQIVTGRHCFGCTAGSGSSCGGALVKE